ncbi:MAG: TIGR03619 family F420-dependent LLM class oxidoreductase [Deltaproteobacteria bacterium]|nr:TIGR03619 family F420-dependent LLM class oxidoreductase [Deltaproteobacteria bacterium]
MQFGIRIPSYVWPDLTYERTRALRGYCRRVEELGFHGIWVIDHLLPSPAIYAVSWLEPLKVLAFVSGVTEHVAIGTGILILPFRHPVLLAKEIASMVYLTGGRFILGVGGGWEPAEYRAMGVPFRERGARTDEVLDSVKLLLTTRNASFKGRFFQFENVTIDPMPPECPPIWVAGGSLTHADAPDKPYIAKSVLRRIMKADAWIGRSSGSDKDSVMKDWEEVKAHARAAGRDPKSILYAHTQFVHIVDTHDREKALREQVPAFEAIMGRTRSLEDLMASYLIGSLDDICGRIEELRRSGLQYLMVNPMTDDPKQLDLIKQHLMDRFPD